MDKDKMKAIENLIHVFAHEFPRRNHIIVVDLEERRIDSPAASSQI